MTNYKDSIDRCQNWITVPLNVDVSPLSRAEHEPDEEPSPERRQHQGSQDPHLPTHENSSGSGRFHNHAARQISRLLTVGSTSV